MKPVNFRQCVENFFADPVRNIPVFCLAQIEEW